MKKSPKKGMKNYPSRIAAVICIAAVLLAGAIATNKFRAGYEQLDEADAFILAELDQYVKSEQENPLWEGFALGDKTIAAMDGTFGNVFLINPKQQINSIFAKKIELPGDFDISVYRISALAPQLLWLRVSGNFNTIKETYRLFGNDVYYTKYEEPKSISAPYSSRHYMTFLAHESFHYYMQENWSSGAYFSTEGLMEKDLELIGKEFDALDKIQRALLAEKCDPVYRAGVLERSFLLAKVPYHTGALLCLLLDALEIPDWQQRLNAQKPEQPVRLFDLIEEIL